MKLITYMKGVGLVTRRSQRVANALGRYTDAHLAALNEKRPTPVCEDFAAGLTPRERRSYEELAEVFELMRPGLGKTKGPTPGR